MRAVLLALAFFLLLLGCSRKEPPPPLPVPPGTISGSAVLFDALDHARTEVILSVARSGGDTEVHERFVTTTRADGGFELKYVPPGGYKLTLRHNTYVDLEVPVVIPEGQMDLGQHVLKRVSHVVDGHTVAASARAPLGDHQLFLIDGRVHLYTHATGELRSLAPTLPVMGGALTPEAGHALLFGHSGTGIAEVVYAGRVGAPPALVTSNAVMAGVSSYGARGWVMTRLAPGTGDLYSFSLGDPTTTDLVAGDVALSTFVGVPAEGMRDVYAKLAYDDNVRVVAGVSVSDFHLFDPSQRQVYTLSAVQASPDLTAGPGKPVRVMSTVHSAGQRNVYLWRQDGSIPTLLNRDPLPDVSFDTTSSPGRVFVIANGAPVAVFDLAENPNYRSALPSLLWNTFGSVRSSIQSRGRTLSHNKYLVLLQGGSSVDLASFDIDTMAVTILETGITRADGSQPTSADDFHSLGLLLPQGRLLLMRGSAPVVVDPNGAVHRVSGSVGAGCRSTFVISGDGSRAACLGTPTDLHLMTISSGTMTSVSLPGNANGPVGVSGTAAAYSIGGDVYTTGENGENPVLVASRPGSVLSLVLVDPGVAIAYSTGEVVAATAGAANSAVTVSASGAFNMRAQGFSSGARMTIQYSVWLREVDASTAPPALVEPLIQTSTAPTMHPSRKRMLVSISNGTLSLGEAGDRLLYPVSSSSFDVANLSDGDYHYRLLSNGRLMAYPPTGSPVDVINGYVANTPQSMHLMGEKLAVLNTIGSIELTLVDLRTAGTTTLANTLYEAVFRSGPGAGTWIAPDLRTIIALTRTGQLFAYDGKHNATLAVNVVASPAPFYDLEQKRLLFSTDRDALHGTTTLRSYPIGGEVRVLVEGARSFALAPDGRTLAAVVVRKGQFELHAGTVDQPATLMGPIGVPTLRSRINTVFSDDATRLFVFDDTGSNGMAWGGAIGRVDLLPLTSGVLGVYPDRTGKNAAIISTRPGGRVLERHVAP
jgi:hypothetical protein